MRSIAAGVIVMWFGTLGSIPEGWALCNGALSTPDLRDRFLIGASATKPPDTTGGSASHVHRTQGAGHQHTIPALVSIDAGNPVAAATAFETVDGTADPEPNLPAFHSLAYIMKL